MGKPYLESEILYWQVFSRDGENPENLAAAMPRIHWKAFLCWI